MCITISVVVYIVVGAWSMAFLLRHHVEYYYYHIIPVLGAGFCDYEMEQTDHGPYNWSETHVHETDQQECVFGPKTGFPKPSYATRTCIGHKQWMDYDSTACLSEAASFLLSIGEVHKS